jgi:hypothetical protein
MKRILLSHAGVLACALLIATGTIIKGQNASFESLLAQNKKQLDADINTLKESGPAIRSIVDSRWAKIKKNTLEFLKTNPSEDYANEVVGAQLKSFGVQLKSDILNTARALEKKLKQAKGESLKGLDVQFRAEASLKDLQEKLMKLYHQKKSPKELSTSAA